MPPILKRKTVVEGDTLYAKADYFQSQGALVATTDVTAGGDVVAGDDVTAGGDVVATGAVTGASVNDAAGQIQNRRYVHQSAVIDISAAGATLSGPIAPSAGKLEKAYWIAAEAFAAGMATGAVKVGIADADGSSNATVDYFCLGTAEANGLLVAPGAVGRVQELALANESIPAGKMLTISHVQQAVAGTVVVILEYSILG